MRIPRNLSEPPLVSVATGVGCLRNPVSVSQREGLGRTLQSALFGLEVSVLTI